jgi:hypothetical protein
LPLSLLVWILAAGCGEKRFEAPRTAAYGAATNSPSLPLAPARLGTTKALPWTNAELAIIESELSPAALCFSQARAVSWFAGMAATGPGGPAFVAISTEQGPKIFKPGERIDPARMRESWFVAWFAGANGWTNWDSPWLLTLQHRPKTIRFDTNGLHCTFAGEAGYAGLMPLYGAYKPLQAAQGASPFATLKEKKKRVLTWEWHLALPADPLARARYWASALREFPIACDESFSVDPAHDAVTIEQSFRRISWTDDWDTKHLKLAPVSPVLAHAFQQQFPAEFSRKPFDMEIFTDFGPYYGVEGVDSYRVTLPVLGYVHATAGAGDSMPDGIDAPCFAAWQQSHRSGYWETLPRRWTTLREQFLARERGGWAAFAAEGRAPIVQAADALGAARIAWRLQDADAYVMAAHRFARALVQLSAQQRGMPYFRENQPWRSMQPIGPNETLAVVNSNGWTTGARSAADKVSPVPDLARILQAAAPKAPGDGIAPQTVPSLERLIPSRPDTPFFAYQAPGRSPRGLAASVELHSSAANRTGWPRLTARHWNFAGSDNWSFGEVTIPKSGPLRAETITLNPSTRIFLFAAP